MLLTSQIHLAGVAPDPQPVANSACRSPITSTTAPWLSAVYPYDQVDARMQITAPGGQALINGSPSTTAEAASASQDNFKDMGTWCMTLMRDTTA